MGIIKDKKKFKRTVKQSDSTNPTGNPNIDNDTFNITSETIRKQKSKK
ncbi:hypothetical protein MTsPCn9_08910 [Croceitalea sp. MTPC9]|nr:hypothetical protein MTsPCn6_34080 [Croceitalea sp. MTPC6]GMN15955.1 hypothetical protein MTsPCn9_08910 [Croceitalea sp. MTPC9]